MAGTLKKNQTANTGKYSYQYVDIAQIHDYLESINAKYIQQIKRIDNDDYVMTKRCFDGVWEEEWLQGCKVVDATLVGVKNPAQEQGSALTYARRYSLLMAFGLATEDNDGAGLTKEIEVTQEEAEKYVLTFGKHNGRLLKEICEEDDSYINWLFESEKTDPIIKKCITLITGKVELSDEEHKEILTYMSDINTLVAITGADFEDILNHYQVKTTADMTLEQLKDCKALLEKKKEKEGK